MNWFLKAVSSYAAFSGRARRSEYWYFYLFFMVFYVAALVVDVAVGSWSADAGAGLVSTLFSFVLLLPGLAVTVRRLHDTGRSGWWVLLYFVPIVGLVVMLVFLCTDSQPGDNAYGPNPKDQGWAPGPGAGVTRVASPR